MWYTNPAWYALVISFLAFAVSGFRLRSNERKTKSEVRRSLTQQAIQINEAFARFGVKSPYAHHLQIPDDRVRDFNSKAALLLNQLNMLSDVFQDRPILGASGLAIYEHWTTTILRPWIEADEDLKRVWFLSKETEIMSDLNFAKWLSDLLPIVKTSP